MVKHAFGYVACPRMKEQQQHAYHDDHYALQGFEAGDGAESGRAGTFIDGGRLVYVDRYCTTCHILILTQMLE
jgi:hypothetical protein